MTGRRVIVDRAALAHRREDRSMNLERCTDLQVSNTFRYEQNGGAATCADPSEGSWRTV
jgi:hypothetical protein